MNADGIIQELGEKIAQLVVSETIAKGQLAEYQQEVARLNAIINEKDNIITELQNKKCSCGKDCDCSENEEME